MSRKSAKASPPPRVPSSRANLDCRAELELKARFGRQLQVFLSAGSDRRAARAANRCTDRGAAPAARYPSDDRAEAGATADLASGLLALSFALRLDVPGRDFVDVAAESD